MAAALAFPTIVPASALGLGGRVVPSNRVTVAVIGTGNQGFNDIKSFLHDERVQVIAVCDVNRESAGYWDGKVGGRDPAKRLVEQHYAENTPSGTYRRLRRVRRFPRNPGPQGHRRGCDLHARPLARRSL